MKIKKISFQNFKHFKDQVIEFDDHINFFIGENNAGKTSILNAIAAIFGLNLREDISYDFPSKLKDEAFTTRIEVTVNFSHSEWRQLFNIHKINVPSTRHLDNGLWEKLILVIADKNYPIIYRLDIMVAENSRNISRDISSNDEIEILQKIDSEIIPLLIDNNNENFEEQRGLIRSNLNTIIRQISTQPTNNPFKPLLLFPYNSEFLQNESYVPFNSLRNKLRQQQRDFQIRAQLYFLKERNPEGFEKFKTRMINYFKGIDQVDLVFNLDTGLLDLVLDSYNRDITLYGGGTKSFATIFSVISLEEYSIIMIDEPDAHIHTSLVKAMYEYLFELSNTKQIFITSHLPDLINLVPIQAIISLELKDGLSKAFKIENKPELFSKMKDMGLISSLFQAILLRSADRIVLCEGKYDGIFLEKFKTKIDDKSESSLNQLNIQYLQIGKRHSTDLNKIKNIMKELFFDKEFVYIRDRDEDTPNELERLVNFDGFPVNVWESRHIESYLLNLDVIANLIHERYPEKIKTQILKEINELIDDEKNNQYKKLVYDYCENKLREFSKTPDRTISLLPTLDLDEKTNNIYNALITRKIDTYTKDLNRDKVKEWVSEFDIRWENEALFMLNAKDLLTTIRRNYPLTNFSELDIIEKMEIIPEEVKEKLKNIYLP